MKKIFVLVTLLFVVGFSLFSQNNINLNFSSFKGNIMFETNGTFTTNFTITGLKTENEIQNFKSIVLANKNVKSFNVFKTNSENEGRKATLVLLNNNDENIDSLLKSLPCNYLIIDSKSYTKDQLKQIKVDLKEKQQQLQKRNIPNSKQ